MSQQNQGNSSNFRDNSLDYGYSTSLYSTPGSSNNYGSPYQNQREKQQFGNGIGGNMGGSNNATSNTCIVANVRNSKSVASSDPLW